MKFNPKDIRKATGKLTENFKKTHDRSRLRVLWSEHSEIIIAAIAAVLVGIAFLFLRGV